VTGFMIDARVKEPASRQGPATIVLWLVGWRVVVDRPSQGLARGYRGLGNGPVPRVQDQEINNPTLGIDPVRVGWAGSAAAG
jgi:hypothetical protein